jgi:phage gpG-like protein
MINPSAQLNEIFSKIESRLEDLSPVLELVSAIVQHAIDENFAAGGRWDGSGTGIFSGGTQKWEALAQSTIRAYKKKGYELKPTLHRSTRGMESTIETRPNNKHSIITTSNSPYAAVHQFGATIMHPGGTPYIIADIGRALFISNKKARELESRQWEVRRTQPHPIDIPARPWLTLTTADVQRIIDTFTKYVIK